MSPTQNFEAPPMKPQGYSPTDPRPLVLFVGRAGGLLMDNVKYAFLEAATHDYGFAPCFLTTIKEEYQRLQDARLPVVLAQRCKPEFLASARCAIFDDFADKCGTYIQAALRDVPKIQLWHGIPLKKIGFPEILSAVNMNPAKEAYLRAHYSGYASVASTSAWATEELFAKAFQAEEFQALGYPRNDVLLRPPKAFDMLHVDTALYAQCKKYRAQGGKIAIYMPTFRDTGGDFLTDKSLDLALLSNICVKHNILLITKFHPYVAAEAFHGLAGFILCESHMDIYPLLPLAHALITDYSSVYFDWLLLQKPILFFAYDKDKYIQKDRELFFPYEDMTPGPVSENGAAFLEDFLSILVQEKDDFGPARTALCNKLFDHKDAHASARWCRYVRNFIAR